VLDIIIKKIKDPIAFKQNNPNKFISITEQSESNLNLAKNKIARALIFDSVYDAYK
jgi:hypothetical protein